MKSTDFKKSVILSNKNIKEKNILLKITDEKQINNREEAWNIVGGLSEPSKIPGYGWSISAQKCRRGSLLKDQKNTICSKCYACNNRYLFKNVKASLERRFNSLKNEKWVDAMIFLLKNEKFFRWFDSGDLQSVEHLEKIVKVCEGTPNCKHWLSTREHTTILKYKDRGNKIPENLCIRISSDFINSSPEVHIKDCCVSSVSTEKIKNKKVINCPATFDNKKECEKAGCYACFDKNVYHVNYKIH